MTETEWKNAPEPHAMLEFLQHSGRPSGRKLRLFAVACSRRVWGWIDVLGQTAVNTAEDFADQLVGAQELRAARLACQGAGDQAPWYAAATNPGIAARNAARSAQAGVAITGSEVAELIAQAALVRDIFGLLPFRPIHLDASWLTPRAVAFALEIYNDRAFNRLPLMADALEESGCHDAEILDHCRQPGPHVRGCWPVDSIMGKT